MPEAKGIEILESFNVRTDEPGRYSDVLLREMNSGKTRNLKSLHPRGRILLAEGERVRGVHLLRSGRASLSVSSDDGRLVILKIAQAGDLLGLNAVLRDSVQDTTVKTLEPCCTDFVSRAQFLELLAKSASACTAVLAIVSSELSDLNARTKSLLLSQATSAKLAKLLLEWCHKSEEVEVGFFRIDNDFTHEQIAQMICSSRETVTRLLAAFRKKQIIRIAPGRVLIADLKALEQLTLGPSEKP
jgi:CRP/FNR family transcriptional regulator, cyclic AMP receptor protein